MKPFPVETIESIWRMQRLINHIAQPFETRKGQEFKLTLSQFRVMRAIAVFPEISAQEICQFDAVNSMLVSRAVAALEKRGWVSRTQDEADGRRMKLTLTHDGFAAFGKMFPNMEARYLDVLSPLSKGERTQLDRLLQKLLAHVTEDADGEESADANVEETDEELSSADPPHLPSDQNLKAENQLLRDMLVELQMENHQLKKQLAAE